MKLLTNRLFSFSFGLIASLSICAMSMQSSASEDQYDELFSSRYAASGFELSEEGVRQALEQFDELRLAQRLATIAVVGEQNYQSLVPYLKDIYNRRPDQAPNVRVSHLYNPSNIDIYRCAVARALVRCGDPDGEQFAIEQALNSPNMGLSESWYAIRTLKYLVIHSDRDVTAELEFLIEVDSDRKYLSVAKSAARELIEIRRYLQLKSDARESIYNDAIERRKQSADSSLRRHIELFEDLTKPSWKESLKLIDSQR